MGVVHAEIVGGGFDEAVDDGEEEHKCKLGEPEGYENTFLEGCRSRVGTGGHCDHELEIKLKEKGTWAMGKRDHRKFQLDRVVPGLSQVFILERSNRWRVMHRRSFSCVS